MSTAKYTNPRIQPLTPEMDVQHPLVHYGVDTPVPGGVEGKIWIMMGYMPFPEYGGYNFENSNKIPVAVSFSTKPSQGFNILKSYPYKNMFEIDINKIDSLDSTKILKDRLELYASIKCVSSSSNGIRSYEVIETSAGIVKPVDTDCFNGGVPGGSETSFAIMFNNPQDDYNGSYPPDKMHAVGICYASTSSGAYDDSKAHGVIGTAGWYQDLIHESDFVDGPPSDMYNPNVNIYGIIKRVYTPPLPAEPYYTYTHTSVIIQNVQDAQLVPNDFCYISKDVANNTHNDGWGFGANKAEPRGRKIQERLLLTGQTMNRTASSTNLIGTNLPPMWPEIIFWRHGLNEMQYMFFGTTNQWADATDDYKHYKTTYNRFYRNSSNKLGVPTKRSKENMDIHAPYNPYYLDLTWALGMREKIRSDYATQGRSSSLGAFWKSAPYPVVSDEYSTPDANRKESLVYSSEKMTPKAFKTYGANKKIQSVINHIPFDDNNCPVNLKVTKNTGLPKNSTNGTMRYGYINDIYREFFNLIDSLQFGATEIDNNKFKVYIPKWPKTSPYVPGWESLGLDMSQSEEANNELYGIDKNPDMEDGGIDLNCYRFNINMTIDYDVHNDDNNCTYDITQLDYNSNDFTELLGTNPSVSVMVNIPMTVSCGHTKWANKTYEACWLIEKGEDMSWEEFCEKLGKLIIRAQNSADVTQGGHYTADGDCSGTSCPHFYAGTHNIDAEIYVVWQKINSSEETEGDEFIIYNADDFPTVEKMTDGTLDTVQDYNFVWKNFCKGGEANEYGISTTKWARRGWQGWLRLMSFGFFGNPNLKTPLIYSYKGSQWGFHKHGSLDLSRFDNLVSVEKFKKIFEGMAGYVYPGWGSNISPDCNGCNFEFLYPILQLMGGKSEAVPGFAPYGHDRDYDEGYAWGNKKVDLFNGDYSFTYGGLTLYECFAYSRDAIVNQRIPGSTPYPEIGTNLVAEPYGYTES